MRTALVVIAVFAALGGIAYAATSGNGTVYGCYNPSSGKPPFPLGVVEQATECGSPSVLVPLNQTGQGGGGVDFATMNVDDVVELVFMLVNTNTQNDMAQMLNAMERTRQQKDAMRKAFGTLVRQAEQLQARKTTVADVLHALKKVNSLLEASPCVRHPAALCR